MRVPTYNGRRAPMSATPLAAPRVPIEGGRDAIEGALSDAGRAIDQVAGVLARSAQEAKRKAVLKESTDGETELTNYSTVKFHGSRGSGDPRRDTIEAAFTGEEAAPKGYLNTNGDEAFEASTSVFSDLQKKRKEIAEHMATPEARELFLQRTESQMSGYFETVERHAGRQRELANIATIEARKAAALDAVRANPNNLSEVEAQAHALNQPIGGLGLSTEDRQAKAMEWHGEVAVTQISAQLERGDWQSAEATLANKEHVLNDKARKTLGAAVEKQKQAGQAEVTAGGILAAAMSPSGEVNQAAAIAGLNRLPADQQARVRPVLDQRMKEAEQAFAADTKRISTSAFSAYNRLGWANFAKLPIADELNERNPELYNRLENDARADLDRLERKKRGTAEDRRAQQSIDTIALNTFLGLTPEERAEADTVEWAKGRGMTPEAASSLLKLKEQARQVVERGHSATESEFVKRAVADAEGTFEQGTTQAAKGRRTAQVRTFEAQARQKFSTWVNEHEGKAPTDEETADIVGKMLLQRTPVSEAGIDRQAEVIIRRGTSGGIVLPEIDFSDGPAPEVIRVRNRKTGATGRMPAAKFNADLYERIDG
jgi:hypothetical protein